MRDPIMTHLRGAVSAQKELADLARATGAVADAPLFAVLAARAQTLGEVA